MTHTQIEMTCDLSLDLIKRSPGFSFDIGSSVAKLVYRPKEDFSQGVPKVQKEGQTTGSIRLVSLPRDDTPRFAEYIKQHCDLSDNKGVPTDVAVTGVGSASFKNDIEKELNIKIQVKTEFDCFVQAFVFISKTMAPDQLYYPLSPESLQKSQQIAMSIMAMMPGEKSEIPGSQHDPIPTVAKKPEFPCILATSGSAMDMKLVESDGTFSIIEGGFFSGRALLAISKLLAGTSDFAEIVRMVEGTDGRTVDAYTTEVVDSSGEGDLYSQMPEFRMFPFGKAVNAEKDALKKEDMVHSIMESMCENFAQMTHATALIRGVKGVYFSGSLITAKRVRDWVTQCFWTRNLALPLDKRIDIQFLKHGSHLGAIGAFMEGATQTTSS